MNNRQLPVIFPNKNFSFRQSWKVSKRGQILVKLHEFNFEGIVLKAAFKLRIVCDLKTSNIRKA